MGEQPDWYELIRAARYLGVSPWELLEQPVIWREWALGAQNAENMAENQRQRAQDRRNKAKGT